MPNLLQFQGQFLKRKNLMQRGQRNKEGERGKTTEKSKGKGKAVEFLTTKGLF